MNSNIVRKPMHFQLVQLLRVNSFFSLLFCSNKLGLFFSNITRAITPAMSILMLSFLLVSQGAQSQNLNFGETSGLDTQSEQQRKNERKKTYSLLEDLGRQEADQKRISYEDRMRTQEATPVEALQGQSSVVLIGSERNAGGASLFYRGAKSEQTLLLWNGFEIQDIASPSASADPFDLNREFSHQVTINTGARALLYGPSLQGGVIQMDRDRSQSGHLRLQSDGIGYWASQLEVKSKESAVGFSGMQSHTSSSLQSGREIDNKEKYSFSAIHNFQNQTNSLRGEAVLSLLHVHSDDDVYPYDDPNAATEWNQILLGAKLRSRGLFEQDASLLWQSLFSQRESQNLSDSLSADSYLTQTRGQMHKLQWEEKLFGDSEQSLVGQLSLRQEAADIGGSSSSLSLGSQAWSHYNRQRAFASMAFVYLAEGSQHLEQTQVGLRVDNLVLGQQAQTSGQQSAPAGGAGAAVATPQSDQEASISLQLGQEFYGWSEGSLYWRGGIGQRLPSLYQLYDPQYGLGSLVPEKSRTIELGWVSRADLIEREVHFFQYQFRDLIQYNSLTSRYFNLGEARIRGIEGSLQWQELNCAKFTASCRYRIAGTYLEPWDQDHNRALQRVPWKRFHGEIIQDWNRELYSSFQFDYVGERLDYKDFQLRSLPEHLLFHAGLSYKPSLQLEIFAKVRNLLATEYEEIWNYSTEGRIFLLGFQSLL